MFPCDSSNVCSAAAQFQPNGRVFLKSDGSLHIERALPEDAGTYVCTAVNVAGSMNITVSLEVHGKKRYSGNTFWKLVYFLSRWKKYYTSWGSGTKNNNAVLYISSHHQQFNYCDEISGDNGSKYPVFLCISHAPSFNSCCIFCNESFSGRAHPISTAIWFAVPL